ncbi:MAG: peptidylprolyl isomerase [Polyangiaceae bacterium]|nr:peptidylprolyl isomerase [Polyangiaceae bacterium]
MMKRCLGPAFLLLACGGPRPAASPVPTTQAGATSLADQCLAEAAAPRQPRADAPEKITLSHVLVRHKDLKRPEGATRSRGEACLRAREAREKLLGGADFAEVVATYADGGDATAGKLGSVSRSDLDPTFADAAFALGVGELSHVVETPRGFHVIARSD